MTPSSNTNESARHLEVTASHDFYIHETHVLPATIKPLATKHQVHGQILSSVTHHTRAKPYIDLHRGDHHRE
jgi:hypothetical protein